MARLAKMSRSEIADLYEETMTAAACKSSSGWLVEFPRAASGCPQEDGQLMALVTQSQRDLKNQKKRVFLKTYVTDTENGVLTCTSPFPSELADVVLISVSPSGKSTAIVRKSSNGTANKESNGGDCHILEFWNNDHLIRQADLSKIGKVIKDGWFEGFDWTPDEKYVVFTVEPKRPKSCSFFKDIPKESTPGKEYEYVEDWGESYTGIANPTLCMANVELGTIQKLQGIPETMSAGQAVFTPEADEVVFTGWEHGPRKVGMIYCFQRRCALYKLSVSQAVKALSVKKTNSNDDEDKDKGGNSEDDVEEDLTVKLTTDDPTARCPRFAPDGRKLMFLGSTGPQTHNTCFSIRVMEWGSAKVTTLVDVVRDAVDDEFPGIYAFTLPTNPWSVTGRYILLNSTWRSTDAILAVDTTTGAVKMLNSREEGSASIIAIKNDQMLVEVSSPTSPYSLELWKFDEESGKCVKTCAGSAPSHVPSDLSRDLKNTSWKILKIKSTKGQYRSQPFEAILLSPALKSGELPPLIVFPHGGPHSAFTTTFSPPVLFFRRLGFAVLLINFRGSTGFGLDNLESLPGRIGTDDITDVVDSVDFVTGKYPQGPKSAMVDASNLMYYGGSHSGFMGGHLTGQFPEMFKAAVLRNPALDIVGMLSASDIPDWACVEAGIPYDFDKYQAATPEMLTKIYKVSPMQYVSKVITPTLLVIGAKDLRVPKHSGIQWYHMLKSQGTPTRMLMYPEDNHPIDKVGSESDAHMNIALWYKEYL